MCLQRILQKTKTNKMVPVWKVVRRSDNYHKFGIYFQGKIVKKGVNKAHIVNIFSSEDGIKHKSGFFCFMNRNISLQYYKSLISFDFCMDPSYKLLKFWIPENTPIVIGVDNHKTVIVSPILLKK